jgi:nuclear pore complex protein Nup93
MIADSLARVRKDFDAFLEEKINLDWNEQRQRICEHFGLVPKEDKGLGDTRAAGPRPSQGAFGSRGSRSVFGRSALEKSVIGSPNTGLGSSRFFSGSQSRNESVAMDAADTQFLREKIGYFATRVQHLNEARLRKQAFQILHEFAEVEGVASTDVCFTSGLPSLFHTDLSLGTSPAGRSLSSVD